MSVKAYKIRFLKSFDCEIHTQPVEGQGWVYEPSTVQAGTEIHGVIQQGELANDIYWRPVGGRPNMIYSVPDDYYTIVE